MPLRDPVVDTLPLGYADGVARSLPLLGQTVLVGGQRCPMAGVITMDQLMVDCGPDSRVAVGDEAVLRGAQGDERISPEEWSARLDPLRHDLVLGVRSDERHRGKRWVRTFSTLWG